MRCRGSATRSCRAPRSFRSSRRTRRGGSLAEPKPRRTPMLTPSVERRDLMAIAHLLQFADSTLPVGAFSFSNGLESAVQHGVVHDVPTLREFVRTATRQAASADGIALLVAHRTALAGDLERLQEADRAVLNRKL